MLQLIGRALRRWRWHEAGNVAILFGLSAVPLVLVMGGVVDFTRYNRYNAELANAVDAASLALARNGEDFTIEEANGYVVERVYSILNHAALGGSAVPEDLAVPFGVDGTFEVTDIEVVETDDGFSVSADGVMDTMFLRVGDLNITSMNVNINAEVVSASSRLEVALVLDNTGSMNCVDTVSICALNWAAPSEDSRIEALKAAADSLVVELMGGSHADAEEIKVAVVPFEGMVNVSSAIADMATPPTWVAWNATTAQPKWEGWNLAPYSGTQRRSHRWLFGRLTADYSAMKWAGCVEMRADLLNTNGTVKTAYELTLAASDTAVPNSLYVPFFWPDEPDYDDEYWNNYLKDKVTGNDNARQRSLTKYSTTSNTEYHSNARRDTEGLLTPYEWGPNKGCPRPILPLTAATMTGTTPTGMNAVRAQIAGMIAYWATGTFIPVGLLWGWQVLTPGVPYDEGVAPGDEYYEETVKAIVLLTDGENEVTGGGPYGATSGNVNESGYSAFNFVDTVDAAGLPRLASSNAAAVTVLNTKTTTLCNSVKTAGIRLYTVTFGGSANQTLMRACASNDDDGQPLFYHAPTPGDLAGIFERIGDDLRKIHLSM